MSAHPVARLVAGLVVPGGGHMLQGRAVRGTQFFLAITVTFALGLLMTDGYAVSLKDHPLAFLLQAPAGLPTFVGLAIDSSRPVTQLPTVPPDAAVAHLDLGLLFTMVAGLLNVLVAFDAYDRSPGGAA